MEAHVKTIREFVVFCSEMDPTAKGIKTFSRLITAEMTADLSRKLIEDCKQFFSIIDYNDIKTSDVLKYKTGFINLHKVRQRCTGDDLETFGEYMRLFQNLYSDHTNTINNLLNELDLPLDSQEALFMRRVFNELGSEFVEMAKDAGNLNIETIIPKFASMLKNGKLMELFNSFKSSNLRMSKVLISVGKILEKHEMQQ